MAKENEERRKGNDKLIEQAATLITEVIGINKRLDIINGSVLEFNRVCPEYRGKVDDIGNYVKALTPQITGLKVKLYTGMALISIISMLIGAGILKLITFLAGG